jgi:hypothetical protein
MGKTGQHPLQPLKANSELEHLQMKSLSRIGVNIFRGGQVEAQF